MSDSIEKEILRRVSFFLMVKWWRGVFGRGAGLPTRLRSFDLGAWFYPEPRLGAIDLRTFGAGRAIGSGFLIFDDRFPTSELIESVRREEFRWRCRAKLQSKG